MSVEGIVNDIIEDLQAISQKASVDDEEIASIVLSRLPDMGDDCSPAGEDSSAVLRSIAVRGVRSFGPEQELQCSRGLTLVYAGNGRGKTSLADAFELASRGKTSRQAGLPNAESEVRDSDHIEHKMAGGIADPSAPPRVLLSYFAEDGLRQCSWTPDSGVDGPCPSVQVLPRRLLRALVNAKRTERLEPLGGAVGLPNLSATWAAVAKELGQRSKGLAEKGQSNLSILRSEINFKGSREDKIQALRSWLEEQTGSSRTRV